MKNIPEENNFLCVQRDSLLFLLLGLESAVVFLGVVTPCCLAWVIQYFLLVVS
jgi:hypothetical protein